MWPGRPGTPIAGDVLTVAPNAGARTWPRAGFQSHRQGATTTRVDGRTFVGRQVPGFLSLATISVASETVGVMKAAANTNSAVAGKSRKESQEPDAETARFEKCIRCDTQRIFRKRQGVLDSKHTPQEKGSTKNIREMTKGSFACQRGEVKRRAKVRRLATTTPLLGSYVEDRKHRVQNL